MSWNSHYLTMQTLKMCPLLQHSWGNLCANISIIRVIITMNALFKLWLLQAKKKKNNFLRTNSLFPMNKYRSSLISSMLRVRFSTIRLLIQTHITLTLLQATKSEICNDTMSTVFGVPRLRTLWRSNDVITTHRMSRLPDAWSIYGKECKWNTAHSQTCSASSVKTIR